MPLVATQRSWIARCSLFLLLLVCGLLTFVVFSHFRPMLSRSVDIPARVGLIAVFLVATLYCRSRDSLRQYWRLPLAFFVASVAMCLDLYLPFSRWILAFLNLDPNSPAGWAMDKLESTVLIVATIILLTRAFGDDLASIYLKRGNIRKGLAIGLATFFLFMATSLPVSELFFGGRDLSLGRVLPWMPWVLIFVLGNALNEELLFRGLFLRKLEPVLGAFASNLLIAILFTLMHTGVEYTSDALLFLAILLPLALAWGSIMQKTDSLWGSVLFHAGADIPTIIGILSAMAS